MIWCMWGMYRKWTKSAVHGGMVGLGTMCYYFWIPMPLWPHYIDSIHRTRWKSGPCTYLPLPIRMPHHLTHLPADSTTIQLSPQKKFIKKAFSAHQIKRMHMKMQSDDKKKFSSKRLGVFFKEQRGRLFIIRRCIVMLLCWQD